MIDGETLNRWWSFFKLYQRRIIMLSAISFCVITLSATLLYLVVPSHRTTSLPFRLEFQNAELGRYPNGTPFSSAEIVGTPILREVYDANELQRFTTFPAFSRSVFILESNPALEAVIREYQAKLNDFRLTSVDRERLEREFQLKQETIRRSQFSINFLSTSKTASIPPPIVKKVLNDTLAIWARKAAEEKGVLRYRLFQLSPASLPESLLQERNPIIAVDLLRSQAGQILRVIEPMFMVPGAEVIRTSEGLTLYEIRNRVHDTARFTIQPLLGSIRQFGVPRPDEALTYLEAQLAYNRQRQRTAEANVAAFGDALDRYNQNRGPAQPTQPTSTPAGDSVTPQITESFIDRLIQLGDSAQDIRFRQDRVQEITAAAKEVIPFYSEILFYEFYLEQARGIPAGNVIDRPEFQARLALAYSELRAAVVAVNEVYSTLSNYLNPSTELYSLQRAPMVEIQHPISLGRLATIGTLLFLLSVVGIILGCWLHARARSGAAAYPDTPSAGAFQTGGPS
jgi:hypothetical protein